MIKWIEGKLAGLVLDHFGGSWLQGILAKLPFNGKKTVLSGLLTCAMIISIGLFYGVPPQWLALIIGAAQAAGGAQIAPAAEIGSAISAFATLIFLFHKWLKRLEKLKG